MRSIGNVQQDGQVRAIASGVLSNGDTVIVNADGTVSAVGSSSQTVGTETTFESAETIAISSAYDSNSGKVVIAYRDNGNSSQGTAIVGTVSGSTISFGVAAPFSSGSVEARTSTVFDSSNNKIVVTYSDTLNSNYGTAVVGTVSGTSISFGTPVVFESASINQGHSATFDSANNKVVVAYRDDGNAGYGTAAIGTVSGTSISFGSPVVFESASSYDPVAAFDSSNGKVVIAYRDAGNSFYGTAIVGAVSGTSISFGSAVVFNSANSIWPSNAFDTANSKVIIAYRDQGNSGYGTAIVGTVSGTSISFGSGVVFEAATSNQTSTVFDTSSGKVVIAYSDDGNSGAGTVISGTVSGTSISFGTPLVYNTGTASNNSAVVLGSSGKTIISYRDQSDLLEYGKSVVYQAAPTNLTSDNFIGFADGAYADTQSAVINTTCSVDRNQTSLTAGQKYYVQTDGSLGLTAGSPSVEAGTAISSTEILVKG